MNEKNMFATCVTLHQEHSLVVLLSNKGTRWHYQNEKGAATNTGTTRKTNATYRVNATYSVSTRRRNDAYAGTINPKISTERPGRAARMGSIAVSYCGCFCQKVRRAGPGNDPFQGLFRVQQEEILVQRRKN